MTILSQGHSSDYTATQLHYHKWGYTDVFVSIPWFTTNYRESRDTDKVLCKLLCNMQLLFNNIFVNSHTHTHTQVHVWLYGVGYLLVYGTLLAKMWRVYQIFHNPNPNKSVSCHGQFYNYIKFYSYTALITSPCIYSNVVHAKCHGVCENISLSDSKDVASCVCGVCCDWCWSTTDISQNCRPGND